MESQIEKAYQNTSISISAVKNKVNEEIDFFPTSFFEILDLKKLPAIINLNMKAKTPIFNEL